MIDISGPDQNKILNEIDLKKYGVELVFHRATLGVPPDADDKGFLFGVNSTLAIGFRPGAYHVIYPATDEAHSGAAQAESFISAVKRACVGHSGSSIALAVDWEPTFRYVLRKGKNDKKAKKVRVSAGTAMPADVLAFLQAIETNYHVSPIVYTGTDVINNSRKNFDPSLAQMANYPLWLATYAQSFYINKREGAPDDQVITVTYTKGGQRRSKSVEARIGYIFPLSEDVDPWQDWMFWQYGGGKRGVRDVTSKSPVTIAQVPVDISFFNGTRAEFLSTFPGHGFQCP